MFVLCVSPWSGRLMLLLVLDYTLVSRLKTVIDAATEPHTKTQFPIKSQIFKIVLEILYGAHKHDLIKRNKKIAKNM